MLSARNLTFQYDSLPVLAGIDLTLERGRITCLLGPSGCGKSTLMSILAGLHAPSSGTVTCAVARPGPLIGYMAQDASLLPWLTVEANIGLPARLNPALAAPTADALDHALRFLRLAECRLRYSDQLSGGQIQRVALLRTLLARPELVLLDEPLGHLDLALRVRATRLIRADIGTRGAAALIVTHDVEEALLLADTIVRFGDRPARVLEVMSLDTADARARARDALYADATDDSDTLEAVA